MKNFKEQLKQELRVEVPYTEDLEQRILLNKRSVKKSNKKFNWQVSMISIATIFIISFIVMPQLILNEAPMTVASLPANETPPFALYKENEMKLPIIEANGQLVIEPSTPSYVIGNQWMLSNLPMIVDPEATLHIGDYVAYYGVNGMTVSTVFGVMGDEVQMKQGQVMVNGKLLEIPDVVGVTERKRDVDPYFFQAHDESMAGYVDVGLGRLEAEQLAVYTNTNGHSATIVKDSQLIGKVVGIQKLEPTFTLTTEEQVIYEAFKENYDLALLQGVAPLTIAKMYVIAEMEQDYKTFRAFFTTSQGQEELEVKQYIEDTQKVREYYFTVAIERQLSAYVFNGIEEGEFEQLSENEGMIHFYSGDSTMPTSAKMIKNEQGIWQPAFTRPIY